ncbi:MAG: CCA tRNA nucleotidyltransferase [Phycisphaerales bacterium]|nr:MAG: CCA tRNA nucleotidyltransferase [Phycisphaerales bacterium]
MNTGSHDALDAALHAIKKLRAGGHVALLAGGCVRDRLLNRRPKDYDVVTDATPTRVKELFPRARQVGAKFGVMLVRKFGHDIEVATFRSDGPYTDGRHPDAVTFGTDVEDARRRDFTINGLFFDPIDERVIDYVDGRSDLEAGVIRTIGDPHRRFAEDHLRMLRAVRFAARLGFEIEPGTAEAIKRLASHLESISTERVWTELEMILTDPTRVQGWTLLMETGLRGHLTPTWPPMRDEDMATQNRLGALPHRPVSAGLALAAALCGRRPDDAGNVCRALRLSNRLSKAVVWMVRSLPAVHKEHSLEIADFKLLMAEESWPDLLELLRGELAGTGADLGPYERVRDRAAAIPAASVTPPPLVTGDDLCDMGMSPGRRIGEILEAIYRAQLNEHITDREQAVTMARKLMGS